MNTQKSIKRFASVQTVACCWCLPYFYAFAVCSYRDVTSISLILSHIVHTGGFKTFIVLLQYRLWSYGSHQRHQQTTSPIPHVYTIPLQWNEEPYSLPAILWLQGKGNQVMALQRIPILEEVCTTYSLITANYNEIVDYHSYIIPQYHAFWSTYIQL